MSKDRVIDSLGSIDDDMIQDVEALRGKRPRPTWLKWGALAACLCLVVGSVLSVAMRSDDGGGDGPPYFVLDGITFVESSHPSFFDELPDGFTYAGETDIDGAEHGPYPYYTNPDVPEWVYVCYEVRTDGTLDSTGTLTVTEPRNAYVRYVDARIRGDDLVCYDGSHFIFMGSARYYTDPPDVSEEYYESVNEVYGYRLEGDVPDGFVSVGITEFSGYDTIPRGFLSSNRGTHEVFVNPNKPDVILVETQWHTAPSAETGETRHEGFDVYIRYDCPLA